LETFNAPLGPVLLSLYAGEGEGEKRGGEKIREGINKKCKRSDLTHVGYPFPPPTDTKRQLFMEKWKRARENRKSGRKKKTAMLFRLENFLVCRRGCHWGDRKEEVYLKDWRGNGIHDLSLHKKMGKFDAKENRSNKEEKRRKRCPFKTM